MNGKNLRVEKLFSKGENAVIVAIDHGMFDGPIPGMIDLKKTAEKINPCVDGVLLSPGMLKYYSRLVNAADKLGIPVIGEYFPAHSGTISREQMHKQVYTCCRILSELGCDMIKTFNTCDFRKVTESCPVPIFGLGSEKTSTQIQALQLAADEIRDGARGVVFRRNAIQVKNPFTFQSALCEVVKNNLTPKEAVAKYKFEDI